MDTRPSAYPDHPDSHAMPASGQSPAGPPPPTEGWNLEDRPKSAARLAAEAAFGPAPMDPPPLHPAPIVVRRSRLREAGPAENGGTADSGAGPGTQRAPRVFRIPAAAVSIADESASTAQPSLPSPMAEAELPPVPRSERIGHDRRSRLIRHIAVAPTQRVATLPLAGSMPASDEVMPARTSQRPDSAMAAALAADLSAALQRLREVEALFAQLEALKRELALIHSARTFRVFRR